MIPEQLVVSRAQRGFIASPLSSDDLANLVEARGERGAIALLRSVEMGDIEWESRVLAAGHRLVRATQTIGRLLTRHSTLPLVSTCASRQLIALYSITTNSLSAIAACQPGRKRSRHCR